VRPHCATCGHLSGRMAGRIAHRIGAQINICGGACDQMGGTDATARMTPHIYRTQQFALRASDSEMSHACTETCYSFVQQDILRMPVSVYKRKMLDILTSTLRT
jgi:hypothetical protein